MGVDTFLRVGSTGALKEEMELGDIIISTAAVRLEGTSKQYVRPEYPASASYEVVLAFVEAAENTDEERYSPGERYARVYEINMLRCIYCGYCEDACPTEAIVLGDSFELSYTSRRSAIYPKEMLLEPVAGGAKPTPQKVEPGVYTRSVPEMKDPVD